MKLSASRALTRSLHRKRPHHGLWAFTQARALKEARRIVLGNGNLPCSRDALRLWPRLRSRLVGCRCVGLHHADAGGTFAWDSSCMTDSHRQCCTCDSRRSGPMIGPPCSSRSRKRSRRTSSSRTYRRRHSRSSKTYVENVTCTRKVDQPTDPLPRLCSQLLHKDEFERLGSDKKTITQHAFFQDINWELLESTTLTPPIRPKVHRAAVAPSIPVCNVLVAVLLLLLLTKLAWWLQREAFDQSFSDTFSVDNLSTDAELFPRFKVYK